VDLVERHIANNMKELMPNAPRASPASSTASTPRECDDAPSFGAAAGARTAAARPAEQRSPLAIAAATPHAATGGGGGTFGPSGLPPLSVREDHGAALDAAPYTAAEHAAGLPLPPRNSSILSDADGVESGAYYDGGGAAGAYRPCDVSSIDPFDGSPPAGGSAGSRISHQGQGQATQGGYDTAGGGAGSRRSHRPIGEEEGEAPRGGYDAAGGSADTARAGFSRRRAADEEYDLMFGAPGVGSLAFARQTAVRWREREADKSKLQLVWLALRLNAVLSLSSKRYEAQSVGSRICIDVAASLENLLSLSRLLSLSLSPSPSLSLSLYIYYIYTCICIHIYIYIYIYIYICVCIC